jgi:hypothetical protein
MTSAAAWLVAGSFSALGYLVYWLWGGFGPLVFGTWVLVAEGAFLLRSVYLGSWLIVPIVLAIGVLFLSISVWPLAHWVGLPDLYDQEAAAVWLVSLSIRSGAFL